MEKDFDLGFMTQIHPPKKIRTKRNANLQEKVLLGRRV